MKRFLLILLVILVAAPLTLSGCGAPAPTSKPVPAPTTTPAPTTIPAADFYKDKSLTILNTSSPGGTADLHYRLAQGYLADLTGAKVGIVNEGSAAGLVAIKKVYEAKPDGLTLLAFPRDVMWMNWMMDQPGYEFDVSKFNYIGSIIGGGTCIVVSPNGPYTSVKAMQETEKVIRFAAQSPASSPAMGAMVTCAVLGIEKAKVVSGYAGPPERLLALTQGEADGMGSPLAGGVIYEADGRGKILLVVQENRDKNFPKFPSLGDFVKLTDYHRTLLKGIPISVYALVAPPGTPDDRVKFLREKFVALCANKGFQQSIIALVQLWQGSQTGEEMTAEALDLVKSKPDLLKMYKTLLDKYVPK